MFILQKKVTAISYVVLFLLNVNLIQSFLASSNRIEKSTNSQVSQSRLQSPFLSSLLHRNEQIQKFNFLQRMSEPNNDNTEIIDEVLGSKEDSSAVMDEPDEITQSNSPYIINTSEPNDDNMIMPVPPFTAAVVLIISLFLTFAPFFITEE